MPYNQIFDIAATRKGQTIIDHARAAENHRLDADNSRSLTAYRDQATAANTYNQAEREDPINRAARDEINAAAKSEAQLSQQTNDFLRHNNQISMMNDDLSRLTEENYDQLMPEMQKKYPDVKFDPTWDKTTQGDMDSLQQLNSLAAKQTRRIEMLKRRAAEGDATAASVLAQELAAAQKEQEEWRNAQGKIQSETAENYATADAAWFKSLPDDVQLQVRRAQLEADGPVKNKREIDELTEIIKSGGASQSYDPRTQSQKGGAYQDNLDSYNASVKTNEMVSDLLPKVIELPGTVGSTGKIAGYLSAVGTIFGQEPAAEAIAEAIAGTDRETIAMMETQMQVLAAQLIPILTREEGSRVSDKELDISRRAAGAIDKIETVSDLFRTYPQVIGAMKQLNQENWVNQYQVAKKEEKIDYPYDLSLRDQKIELVEKILEAGVDADTAQQTLARLMKIQGVK